MKVKNFLYTFIKKLVLQCLDEELLTHYKVFGDYQRLIISEKAVVNNALFNTCSGEIKIKDYAFFGHNVCLLTGTHDYTKYNRERQLTVPKAGRDILIEEGVWIASNVTILGPCIIGKHAVIAANSLVNQDVPGYSIYAGVPARFIKKIEQV